MIQNDLKYYKYFELIKIQIIEELFIMLFRIHYPLMLIPYYQWTSIQVENYDFDGNDNSTYILFYITKTI